MPKVPLVWAPVALHCAVVPMVLVLVLSFTTEAARRLRSEVAPVDGVLHRQDQHLHHHPDAKTKYEHRTRRRQQLVGISDLRRLHDRR